MFLEKDFEDILSKYPELIEDGLTFKGRQVTVYGRRIDLLFEDRFRRRLIIELKKGPVKDEHIGQIMSYEGMLLSCDDPTIRIMLVGNRVPPNIQRSLDHHGIAWREITYSQLREFLQRKNDFMLLKLLDDNRELASKVTEKAFPAQRIQIIRPVRSLQTDEIPWSKLDEKKYTMKEVFERQKTNKTGRDLIFEFHTSLDKLFSVKKLDWWARTHAFGLSYFCNKNRAFLALNMLPNHFWLHFYTGNSSIIGLEKSTWSKKEDGKGSKPLHVFNSEDISKAIIFAEAAYRIIENESIKIGKY